MPPKKKPLIFISSLLVFLIISILLYANHLIQSPSIQGRLIEKLSRDTGLNLKTEKIELSFWKGIGIHVTGFSTASKDGEKLLSASDVIINISAKDLVRGRIAPSRIYLKEPRIDIVINRSVLNRGGENNIKGIPFFWMPDLDSLHVEKGQLNIKNNGYGISEFSFSILKKDSSSFTLMINSMGKLEIKGEEIPFKIKGTLIPSFKTGVLPLVDLIIETEKAPLNLLPKNESFAFHKGQFITRLNIRSMPGGIIESGGKIFMKSVSCKMVNDHQQKDFSIPEASLDFLSHINGRKMDFSEIKMKMDNLHLDASLNIDLENPENPHIGLSIRGEIMPVALFKNIFPSPLLPSWIEKSLFPMLTQGDVKLHLFELNGDIMDIKHPDLPQNKSALKLKLECNEMTLEGNEFEIPIQKVSSQISLENGELYISEIGAASGDSMINFAGFRMKDVFNSDAYEFSVDGIFRLEELLANRIIRNIPESLIAKIDKMGKISGKLDCKVNAAFEPEWESPRIIMGEFHLIDCMLQPEQSILPLSLKDARIHIHETNQNEFNAKGSFGLSRFNIIGSFGITDDKIQLHKADIFADAEINQLLPLIIDCKKIPLTFKKPLACHMSAIKETDYYSFSGSLDLGGIGLETEEYSINPPGKEDNLIFNIDYWKGDRLELKKSIARFGNSFIRISGLHSMRSTDPTEVDVSTHNISLEEFDIRPKGKSTRFEGSLNGGLKIIFPRNDGEGITLTGSLQGEDVLIDIKRLSSPIKDCDFRFGLDGKRLKIDVLKMKVGESDMSVNGLLSGWNELKGALTIDSDYIDVKDLAIREETSHPGDHIVTKNTLTERLDLIAHLKINKGRWNDLNIGPSTAMISFRNGDLEITNSLLTLDHGRAEITGLYKIGENPEISFSGDIRLSMQPADEILSIIHLPRDKIKGDLTINADLSIKGRKKEELLPSLSGAASIKLMDGYINKSRIFLKVLDLLSLQNIFNKRWPGLNDEGFYFESIQGDADISEGVIMSDNLVMKSPVFNAIAYGKADLVERSFDFTLGVQPHGSIDTLVSSIPLLGHIITGEKKSIIAYPFLVKGSFGDPEIIFSPLKGLGGGVVGIFERLLMTPSRIIDELQKNSPKNGKDASEIPHENK